MHLIWKLSYGNFDTNSPMTLCNAIWKYFKVVGCLHFVSCYFIVNWGVVPLSKYPLFVHLLHAKYYILRGHTCIFFFLELIHKIQMKKNHKNFDLLKWFTSPLFTVSRSRMVQSAILLFPWQYSKFVVCTWACAALSRGQFGLNTFWYTIHTNFVLRVKLKLEWKKEVIIVEILNSIIQKI